MNDNEINIAIAEACGWQKVDELNSSLHHFRCWVEPGTGRKQHWKFRVSPPSYTTDLNAMHEAEKVLTAEQFQDYDIELTDQYVLHQSNNPIHATARQRAEAFLRTLGKWKD